MGTYVCLYLRAVHFYLLLVSEEHASRNARVFDRRGEIARRVRIVKMNARSAAEFSRSVSQAGTTTPGSQNSTPYFYFLLPIIRRRRLSLSLFPSLPFLSLFFPRAFSSSRSESPPHRYSMLLTELSRPLPPYCFPSMVR